MRTNLNIKYGSWVLIGLLSLVILFIECSPDTERRYIRKESSNAAPSNELDRLLAEMEFASIAFNTPKNINIDESPTIQLILSLSETIEELEQSIAIEGERIGASIKVSNRMEAQLKGEKFTISAITPEIQAVSRIERTEWKWRVHPKREGKHYLDLTISAHVEIDGHNTRRKIRVFERIIEVNVFPTQKINFFIKDNWKWLWAAILVPIFGWFWKKRKSKNLGQSGPEG
ncbi:MAG: hypothetical protein H8E26_11360 [FCB group bacterium]|nr:hypothetical protein [FCB group bacterium]MBL7029218.1 hypothetical protein [Candidatus Neomarinimicrobiota bacterium]MBL7121132.1 hypothetical protein [Candidatus Neomarinimicrobiota bacterium]